MYRTVWLERLVVLAAGAVLVWGVGSFGLWDPWELTPKTQAIALWFLPPGELALRLPNVMGGVLAALLVYVMLRGTAGVRAGVAGIVVVVTTPMLLLNARLAMGNAIGIAAQAWVGASALYVSTKADTPPRRALGYLLLSGGLAASAWISGVLLGPLPPCIAVACLTVVTRETVQDPWSRWLFPLGVLVMVAGIAHAVRLDSATPSFWLGAGAFGGDPPTWEAVFTLIFHGFAPWSVALPIAIVWSLRSSAGRAPKTDWALSMFVLWIAFACVTWTVFASRYGDPPFLAVAPLSCIVGLWLERVAYQRSSGWPAAVVVTLLTVLLVRDYVLYPSSALHVLAGVDLKVPEVYRAGTRSGVVFALVGGALVSLLVSRDVRARPSSRHTWRWWRAQWHRGWPTRGWLLVALSLLGACVVFGSMCFVLDLKIASIVLRIGRVAFFAPLVLVALVFGLPWLRYAFASLDRARIVPVLAVGLLAGAFLSWSFQPELSRHFSPKPVYETYRDLTDGAPEPLAVYRVSPTAASYYTQTAVREISDQRELLEFLHAGKRRWAVVPADRLATLDVPYRREHDRHLYVADASSAQLLLVASQPVEGRPTQSFVAQAVLDQIPTPQYSVRARFEDRVQLLGYDLTLPSGDSVGAGQRFELTWYWKTLEEPPKGYEVFVHIDGDGLRLNGDHAPVDGRYPPSLWESGDIVADTHSLLVPPNFRSGDFAIYVGWFRGGKRLAVESGPHDGGDRVRAGVLRVR